MNNKKNLFLVVLIAIFLTACGAFKPKYTDSRKVPIKGAEKARKNIEEGRGISLGSLERIDLQILNLVRLILYGERPLKF